ncbi:MAG: SBBP repeat-containing protein, partial [Pyrinomonadaceae bacterium]
DAQGNFFFGSLSRGGRYELKPDEPAYEFFPPSVTWEGLTQNETWDFVAAGPLPPGATPTPTPGSGALTWERFYDGPQHLADFDSRIAVDAQGNSFVAATSGSATDGDTDITLVKYSPTGTLLWSTSYVGEGNYKDWASDVKTDADGNVYVVGTSWAAAFPGSEYDIVTLKYNAAGQRQWAKVYNGPIGHWDLGYALTLDLAGNVVVAGSSQSSTTGALFDEFVTIKYDAAGNELWTRRHSTQQIGDDAYSLAVDASNNVYVNGTGYTQTGGATSRDIITVKYDAAGTKQWASRFTGGPENPGPAPLPNNPVSNESGGVRVDPSGNLYVFGANNADTSESDYLLLKYNPATGALLWSRNWSGESNDYPRDMVIDASGNIYLTGESWDGDYQQATSKNTWDAATVKFDGAGTLQWARIYRGFPGKVDGGRELALDAAGNVYVGGFSEGFVNGDTFVIKYKPDGTEQWVYRYDNPEHTSDSLGDMTSDASGNLYLAGQAVLTNAQGQETADLVTVKLAASTAQLNDPPEVSVIVGPTIAGHPESFDGNRMDSDSDTVGGPDGPTIAGRSIVLGADASDIDGTVASVSFYNNGTLLGTTNAAPYTFQWNDAALGTHAVSATATDNHGATRTSATVNVTFTDPQPTPTPTPVLTPTPTPTPVSTPTPTPTPNATPTPTPTPVPGMVRVSGRVLDKNFGTGVAGLSVTLSGDATATTQTDAQGRYAFASLPTGGAYTVMVSAPGWIVSPHARTFLDCRSDKAADFEVAPASDDIPAPEPIVNFVEVPGDPCANDGCDPAPSLGAPANLLDSSTYFVAHHYLDFLGRGADTAGLKFWKSEIDGCGLDTRCREVKRINVSAAFFLSIEFQETGYLIYRLGLVSEGEAPRYARLMEDSRTIATGVQVGRADWEARLAENRRRFADEWVSRAEFKARYGAMTQEQYVSALLSNAKLDLGSGAALVAGLKEGRLTRAEVLLRVADDAELKVREQSRAFVRMQYYGYLRRDPDAEGYNYWLSKLEGFHGDFIHAEMVKAFLDSAEYRRRFAAR